MNDLRVYLRDQLSGEWTTYTPDAWLAQYHARIDDALAQQAATFGGSFGLTGTPERGRIIVCGGAGDVILDFDWHTMTVTAAVNHQER